MVRTMCAARVGALLVLVAGGFGPLEAQERTELRGQVLDVNSGQPVSDVVIRLENTLFSALTDQDGRFVLEEVPAGERVLVMSHLAYGEHRRSITLSPDEPMRVEIRMGQEAVQLDPLVVQGETTAERAQRGSGSSQWVVERDQIEAATGTSRHLGDLIRQTIPGIDVRQANRAGVDVCVEFRAARTMSLIATGCRSPEVYLDGVPVSDPQSYYALLPLNTIDRIEVVPPGQAGARYGTGSMFGVILIDTIDPRSGSSRMDRSQPVVTNSTPLTFDWDMDPHGHPTGKSFLGAALGNAVGLAAGLAIARSCFEVDEKDEIRTSCSSAGNVGSALAAFVLPAVASGLGARWGGGTDMSRGRLVPAVLGAALVLLPGYAFALATEGNEAGTVNQIGYGFIAVGVPFAVTISDKLFRNLR